MGYEPVLMIAVQCSGSIMSAMLLVGRVLSSFACLSGWLPLERSARNSSASLDDGSLAAACIRSVCNLST